MTTPTTCEPTEEQRLVAYGIASGNQLSHDDLENLIAQALAQESSRANERAEGLQAKVAVLEAGATQRTLLKEVDDAAYVQLRTRSVEAEAREEGLVTQVKQFEVARDAAVSASRPWVDPVAMVENNNLAGAIEYFRQESDWRKQYVEDLETDLNEVSLALGCKHSDRCQMEHGLIDCIGGRAAELAVLIPDALRELGGVGGATVFSCTAGQAEVLERMRRFLSREYVPASPCEQLKPGEIYTPRKAGPLLSEKLAASESRAEGLAKELAVAKRQIEMQGVIESENAEEKECHDAAHKEAELALEREEAATARVAEMQDRMVAAFGEGTTAEQLVAISHEHEARVEKAEARASAAEAELARLRALPDTNAVLFGLVKQDWLDAHPAEGPSAPAARHEGEK